MAGLAAGNHHLFFPLVSRFKVTSAQVPALHLSSSESMLFSLSLYNSTQFRCKTHSIVYISTCFCRPIAARYGGNRSAEDEALDISSIKSGSVRLIDEKQNMVGVVSKSVAIQMAEDVELDLVIVSPDADPPVVRIMDFDKYRYEQQKKKREQQKRSAANRMDLKELKMGYNIDVHDYSVRLKAAQKFLKEGDKVKVMVSLKGRENEFRNIAIELLRRFQNDIGELAIEESKNFRDRNIFMVLVPNKAVLQKASEPSNKKDKSSVNELDTGSARCDDRKDGGWKERMDEWKMQQGNLGPEPDDYADLDMAMIDEARQPLYRKVPIASRMIIVNCDLACGAGLLPSISHEREGEPSMLAPIDIFISTVDLMKEPPLVTANTILSILAMDCPVEKVSCYLSDDGAAMLTFEAL
ncbi:hypothetical protein Ancab_017835 [Ancistrocladus abbreviatus]